ncbi:hypothetical protein L6452_02072 [Arctium lappa]|uniref:Uncharacterized protein n=1 Tax=Arctium lappa TaxID=4217 RepID=A0ACB9FI31_ARCLA|nr:hypothetical protein L6452_02072 [Arctium lappa]
MILLRQTLSMLHQRKMTLILHSRPKTGTSYHSSDSFNYLADPCSVPIEKSQGDNDSEETTDYAQGDNQIDMVDLVDDSLDEPIVEPEVGDRRTEEEEMEDDLLEDIIDIDSKDEVEEEGNFDHMNMLNEAMPESPIRETSVPEHVEYSKQPENALVQSEQSKGTSDLIHKIKDCRILFSFIAEMVLAFLHNQEIIF